MSLTPEEVENRLVALSKEVDLAHEELGVAERNYHEKKVAFELNMAKSRVIIAHSDHKMRVQEIDDRALMKCESEFQEISLAEALVKSARSNAQRVRTQVDIARSVGTSVRAAMDL